ncbi:kinase-like protein [Rozella allomycis CSF55]|uniref:Kinase-like protein n=1 Tax=Rozella allomycis (strain CSF55) TaxID=988480 RepID=A0A075ATM8_ROZAC|nr:Protein kinase, catalytic domain-containing protein [Rozella allomycis CSF55]RKP20550.1 kinase-like protein [Rozella allomycis CSF55]|eukprot:EPZ33631.1 Protein kinase, catalytic domain-containing protein [Rozella allomycis CSF55]
MGDIPAHKILSQLTCDLVSTFQQIDPLYAYQQQYNPKRVLTKPSKPAKNNGYDNENSDYILYVNDVLGDEEGKRYLIMDTLGQGTFGQVVKAQNLKTKEFVAVKVIKNSKAYFNQSMMEVTLLEMINNKHDVNDQFHITRLKDTFIFRKHLCIVSELMSINLYELLKQNHFKGLSLRLIRVFMNQLLEALSLLHEIKIIHADLKPENILLKDLDSPNIKLIDFGSACHEHNTPYTYIQSRFYRSPEVLLGLPYTSSIDMWSLGCIAAELFLGIPIFPGSSEFNQITRIVNMMGMPPNHMLENGKNTNKFFSKSTNAQQMYSLKTLEAYSREFKKDEKPSKRYFQGETLQEVMMSYPVRKKATTIEVEKEIETRKSFIDFVSGCLKLNPLERWTPIQAKKHPFILNLPFNGPFDPNRLNYQSQFLDDQILYRRNRSNTLGHIQVPSHLLKVPVEATLPSTTYHANQRLQYQETAYQSIQDQSDKSPAFSQRRRSSVMMQNVQNPPSTSYLPVQDPPPVSQTLQANLTYKFPLMQNEAPQINIMDSQQSQQQPQSSIPPQFMSQRLQTYLQQRRVSNPPHLFTQQHQAASSNQPQMFIQSNLNSHPQLNQTSISSSKSTDSTSFLNPIPEIQVSNEDGMPKSKSMEQFQNSRLPPVSRRRSSVPSIPIANINLNASSSKPPPIFGKRNSNTDQSQNQPSPNNNQNTTNNNK